MLSTFIVAVSRVVLPTIHASSLHLHSGVRLLLQMLFHLLGVVRTLEPTFVKLATASIDNNFAAFFQALFDMLASSSTTHHHVATYMIDVMVQRIHSSDVAMDLQIHCTIKCTTSGFVGICTRIWIGLVIQSS